MLSPCISQAGCFLFSIFYLKIFILESRTINTELGTSTEITKGVLKYFNTPSNKQRSFYHQPLFWFEICVPRITCVSRRLLPLLNMKPFISTLLNFKLFSSCHSVPGSALLVGISINMEIYWMCSKTISWWFSKNRVCGTDF